MQQALRKSGQTVLVQTHLDVTVSDALQISDATHEAIQIARSGVPA